MTNTAARTSPTAPSLRVGVIGAGRIGPVLASALRASGHQLTGITARSEQSRERVAAMLPGVKIAEAGEIARASDLVMLCVGDDAIAPLVAELAEAGDLLPGQIVAHVAGRFGTEVLDPARQAGALTLALHPAMTFTGTSVDLARLPGCPWAITAPATLIPLASALVIDFQGEPFVLPEADRPAYHAALTHGANHLVTTVAQASRMLAELGIEDPGRVLEPLTQAALQGVLRSGEAALTGPVSRGDIGTVAEHLDALREMNRPDLADIAPTYRELARVTARRCYARGTLSEDQMSALLDELDRP